MGLLKEVTSARAGIMTAIQCLPESPTKTGNGGKISCLSFLVAVDLLLVSSTGLASPGGSHADQCRGGVGGGSEGKEATFCTEGICGSQLNHSTIPLVLHLSVCASDSVSYFCLFLYALTADPPEERVGLG